MKDSRWMIGGFSIVLLLILLIPWLERVAAQGARDVDDRRSRGSQDAPLLLIEYSDFTCGFCRKFFIETWPQLREKYVATGKVRFEYRDYPRANHGLGLEAAVAARCAGDQDQYWPMHDLLFSEPRIEEEAFQQHARALKLDVAAFERCRRDRPHEADIFRDKVEALQWGFRGTPAFILMPSGNGRGGAGRETPVGLPGAFPYEVFEEKIDEMLAKTPTAEKG